MANKKHTLQRGDEVITDDGSRAVVLDDKTTEELAEMGISGPDILPGHEYAVLVRESDGAEAVRDARTLRATGKRFSPEVVASL